MTRIDTFTEVETIKNPMNQTIVKKKVFVEAYDKANDQFIVNWNWARPFKDVIGKDDMVYYQLVKLFPPHEGNQVSFNL